MAWKPDIESVCGIEIPAEQRTPLVEALLRVIEQLQATNQQLQATVQRQQLRIEQLEEEIRRLKGVPEPPKRPPQPSPLSDPKGPPSATGKKKPATPDGKRPGSAKRSKTRDLIVHEDRPLLPDGLPDGAEFLGYHDFTVQDLKVEAHNTRYRRGRYRLPDGTIVTAPLPTEVYIDLVLISDDAGQFKLLAFLHALCWVHLERHVAQLIPLVDRRPSAARHGAGRDLELLPATEGVSGSTDAATAGTLGQRLRPAV